MQSNNENNYQALPAFHQSPAGAEQDSQGRLMHVNAQGNNVDAKANIETNIETKVDLLNYRSKKGDSLILQDKSIHANGDVTNAKTGDCTCCRIM